MESDEPRKRIRYEGPYSFQCLEEADRGISDHSTLLKKYVPVTTEEAIVLAAKCYDLDLTRVQNPMHEYQKLSANPSAYTHQDVVTISKQFNPMLPECMYSKATLEELAVQEGFRREDLHFTYNLLCERWHLPTFFHGRVSGVSNEETVIDNEVVAEIPDDVAFCYGTRGNLIAYRARELSKLFAYQCSFIDPVSNTEIDDIAINKLTMLCAKANALVSKEICDLQQTIERVRIIRSDDTNHLRMMKDAFNNPSTEQTKIIDAVMSLFDLGMYMRGWTGGSQPYPVAVAPIDNQNDVDLRVTEAFAEFNRKIEAIGYFGDMIMDTRLQTYERKGFSTCGIRQASTVRSRLEMVTEHADDCMAACIRLASNWLCPTAYVILMAIGAPLPIDIRTFRVVL